MFPWSLPAWIGLLPLLEDPLGECRARATGTYHVRSQPVDGILEARVIHLDRKKRMEAMCQFLGIILLYASAT